jgi:hypothetical protein
MTGLRTALGEDVFDKGRFAEAIQLFRPSRRPTGSTHS